MDYMTSPLSDTLDDLKKQWKIGPEYHFEENFIVSESLVTSGGQFGAWRINLTSIINGWRAQLCCCRPTENKHWRFIDNLSS